MCAQKVGARIVIGRYGYKSSFGANNNENDNDDNGNENSDNDATHMVIEGGQ